MEWIESSQSTGGTDDYILRGNRAGKIDVVDVSPRTFFQKYL